MTEIERNEKLAQLRNEEPPAPRKTGRRYRRQMKIRKNDALMRIIAQSRYFLPHVGFIKDDFRGKTLYHSGRYIKYPKNSNCQRWIKKAAHRRSRNSPIMPPKGNYYRRLFDYWWTLY